MKAVSTDNGKAWQMYDLSHDIGEQTDLAASRPNELRSLVAMQQEWEAGLMPPQWGWNSALGYRDPDFGKPQPYHDARHYTESAK